ncbi:MAG: bacteriocin [Acidobacteria bacterium]|nr:MAG: bacteriocin [Acidobacteriota bacterium]
MVKKVIMSEKVKPPEICLLTERELKSIIGGGDGFELFEIRDLKLSDKEVEELLAPFQETQPQ